MPTFDPETFLQQTIDAPLETEFKLIPPGEYEAYIGEFTAEALQTFEFEYKKGPRAGQPGSMTRFRVPFVIQDPKVAADLGRDQAIAYGNFTIDFDDTTGNLATGPNKNVALGQLRDAVGQNSSQYSLTDLRNQGPVMIRVEHRKFDRNDGSKGENAEVTRVAPIRRSKSAA